MNENPPRKPRGRPGIGYRWVKAVYRRRRVRGRFQRVQVRRGHWRAFATGKKAPSRAGWVGVMAYQKQLARDWDLMSSDPMYKKDPAWDVLKLNGPLSGLIWETPFQGDNKSGDFTSGRVWYIVENVNEENFWLFTRHSGYFGGEREGGGARLVVSTLQMAREELKKLQEAIIEEYETKDYMRVREFVAWTAWERVGAGTGRKYHKKRQFLSKERGRSIINRSGRYLLAEDTTAWEINEAIDIVKGEQKAGTVGKAARRFKSPYEFRRWLKSLPEGERRRARTLLTKLVKARWEKIEARRRAAGKWKRANA